MQSPETLKNFIIKSLMSQYPGHDWAFVVAKDEVYFSVLTKSELSPVQSPVTILLQQIFDLKKDFSFFILRKPIYINYRATAKDQGMVKVVAKRLVPLEVSKAGFDQVSMKEAHPELRFFQVDAKETSFATKVNLDDLKSGSYTPAEILNHLVQKIERGDVLHDYDRPVAAILVSEDNELLEFAVNASHVNKTLHAEVNLLQKFFKKNHCERLPTGSKVFVTHKPCKMCAGMIHESFFGQQARSEEQKNNSFEPCVFYFEEVSGSHSKSTVLDLARMESQLKCESLVKIRFKNESS